MKEQEHSGINPSAQESSPLHEQGRLTPEHWQEVRRLLSLEPNWYNKGIGEELIAFADAQLKGLNLVENSYLGCRHWLRLSEYPGEVKVYATSKAVTIENLSDNFYEMENDKVYSIKVLSKSGFETFIEWKGEPLTYQSSDILNNEWQRYHFEPFIRVGFEYIDPDGDTSDSNKRYVTEDDARLIRHPHMDSSQDIQPILDRFLLTLEDFNDIQNVEDIVYIPPSKLYSIATKIPEERLIERLKALKPEKDIYGWEKPIPQAV